MAWILVDDLSGEHVQADRAARLQLFLDNGGNGDDAVRLLGEWDVDGDRPDDDIRADLGEHLTRQHDERPLDPGPLDDLAEDPPSVDHDESSSQVSEPDPVDESAENGIRPSVAQPIESPRVSVKPAVTDTPAAAVAVSGTQESQRRAAPAPASAAAAEPPWRPGAVKKGDAERGRATDAVVRRWARDEGLADPGARVQLPAWVRVEYERLHGGVPDFRARRVAREHGTPATTPEVDPGVASLQTIHVWCLRNGVEDRLPPTTDAKTAYRAAWIAARPQPPARVKTPPGEDPPAPDERAGQAAPSGAGEVNGHALPDEPAIEPIGQGDQPRPAGDGHAAAVAMAETMLGNRSTPKAVANATGLDVAEVRDLEAQLRKARGKR